MYRSSQGQMRPSSASSSFTKTFFQNTPNTRMGLTPHHPPPSKPFQNQPSPFHTDLMKSHHQFGMTPYSSISESRIRKEPQILHFRYINKSQQMGKSIQNETVKNDWEARFFTLYNSIEQIHTQWDVSMDELQEISRKVNHDEGSQTLLLTYCQHMKKTDQIFKNIQGILNSKEVKNFSKKQVVNKENIQEKPNEDYILKLQSDNIKLNSEINQFKQKIQKLQQGEKTFRQALQAKQLELEQKLKKIHLKMEEKEHKLMQQMEKYHLLKEESQQMIEVNGNLQKKNDQFVNTIKQLQTQQNQLITQAQLHQNQVIDLNNTKNELGKLKEQNSIIKKQYHDKINQVEMLKMAQMVKVSQSQMEKIHQQNEHKIDELTQIAKEKDEKIKELKDIIVKQEQKINQIGDNYISQNQLQTLHKKIEEYEKVLLTEGGTIYDKLNNQTHDYFNGKVFENQIIYQLKKDNKKLTQFIEKSNLACSHEGRVPETKLITEPSSPLSALQQSHILLQDAIYKLNKILEKEGIKHESPKKSPQKMKKSKDNSQLLTLKVYLIEVNQYCTNTIKSLEEKTSIKMEEERMKEEQRLNYIEKLRYQLETEKEEEISFYKKQSEKQEERIDSLLSINSKLKEQLTKKSPQKKSNQEQYWKNQIQLLQNKIFNLDLKLKKIVDEKIQLQEEFLQEQNKSVSFSTEVYRLRQQLEKSQVKMSKINEEAIEGYLQKIQEITVEKQDLERQLGMWSRKHKDSQWKLNNLLEQMTKLSAKNVQLETKLQGTEVLFNKINQLQIKIVDLNHSMTYKAPTQILYSYITKFAYQQLFKNMRHIVEVSQSEINQFTLRQISHDAGICIKTLQSIDPIDGSNSKDKYKNIDYILQLVESVFEQINCLVEEMGTNRERDEQIGGLMKREIEKCMNIMNQLI